MVKKLSIKSAVLGACIALASTGFAGEVSSGKEGKTVAPPEAPVQSWITGDMGDTVITKYISRGIVLESEGVINQPYLDLFLKVYDGKGFINSISAQFSFWSSINSRSEQVGTAIPGETPGLSTTRKWYEFDWDPGITVTFAKNFTYTIQYFEFDSPEDAFVSARSINQTLAINDSDWLGVFALHPHFTTLAELQGKAGLGNLKEQGWYFEQGIAPGYTFLPKSDYPITLTIPVTIGEGTKEFYNGTNFGYLSAGTTLSVPLAFIPKQLGSWTASASYLYYYLAQRVADQSPMAIVDANGNGHMNQSQHVFSGTLGFTF